MDFLSSASSFWNFISLPSSHWILLPFSLYSSSFPSPLLSAWVSPNLLMSPPREHACGWLLACLLATTYLVCPAFVVGSGRCLSRLAGWKQLSKPVKMHARAFEGRATMAFEPCVHTYHVRTRICRSVCCEPASEGKKGIKALKKSRSDGFLAGRNTDQYSIFVGILQYLISNRTPSRHILAYILGNKTT